MCTTSTVNFIQEKVSRLATYLNAVRVSVVCEVHQLASSFKFLYVSSYFISLLDKMPLTYDFDLDLYAVAALGYI